MVVVSDPGEPGVGPIIKDPPAVLEIAIAEEVVDEFWDLRRRFDSREFSVCAARARSCVGLTICMGIKGGGSTTFAEESDRAPTCTVRVLI